MRDMLAVMNSDRDLHDMLSLVAKQSMVWLRSTDVIIGRFDATTQDFSTLVAQGPRAAADLAVPVAFARQALVTALAAQEPILFHDLPDAAGVADIPESAPEPPQVVLAVPLLIPHDQRQGGMLLYYRHPPELSAPELELATLLGEQAALAIGNADQKSRADELIAMNERNRIARDLHDSVTQNLYTMSLIAETLPEVWQKHPDEAFASIEKLQVLARGALAEMRALLLENRAGEEVDRSLGELLRQLPDRMIAHSNLQVTTTIGGKRPLRKGVQVALYRIAQEALNNVDKHARATRAAVHLDFRSDGRVMLRVSDNGCGIDPTCVNSHRLGIGIMRERAQEIGAELTISSEPGQGTQVEVTWHEI